MSNQPLSFLFEFISFIIHFVFAFILMEQDFADVCVLYFKGKVKYNIVLGKVKLH